MIGLADIYRARLALTGVARRTPLVPSPALSHRAGRPVYLKLENWQLTGSFKIRGALAWAAAQGGAGRGLITASAGNHGQGVALAGRRLGLPVTVLVPASAPAAKQEAIRRLGARLLVVQGDYDAAHRRVLEQAREEDLQVVPAFEDDLIIAGQGTVGLEIFEDLPDAAALLVPVGGGGLLAGVAAAATHLSPEAAVWGFQSERTPAMHRSLAAGRAVPVEDLPTLCDGLAGGIHEHTLDYARRLTRGVRLVTEEAVAGAIRFLAAEERLLVEGSAAVGVAALLSPDLLADLDLPAGPVVCILSGANIDLEVLARVLGSPRT